MSMELHFSGGTLAPNGDLEIHRLGGSRRFARFCEDIDFPFPVKRMTLTTAVILNSHTVYHSDKEVFVFLLKEIPPSEDLGELQDIINASDAKLRIILGERRRQHDHPRTHRMSKARCSNSRR